MMMYTLMRSWNISFIIRWNVAGAFVIPKNMTVGSYSPRSVMKANFSSSPSLMRTLLYPHLKSRAVNMFASDKWSRSCWESGK